ncbi:hypothetical protein FRC02_010204 [Tulasnella sp. 418]|nr:hypothetical protein FRC02_010204 [Tulasnella sp. 418]
MPRNEGGYTLSTLTMDNTYALLSHYSHVVPRTSDVSLLRLPDEEGYDFDQHLRPHQKKKGKSDISRPRNSFMMYRSAFVARTKQLDDSPRNNRQISKVVGIIWNSLDEKAKAPWEKLALDEKERHRFLYPDYSYSPVSKSKKRSTLKAKAKAKRAASRQRKVVDDDYEDDVQDDEYKPITLPSPPPMGHPYSLPTSRHNPIPQSPDYLRRRAAINARAHIRTQATQFDDSDPVPRSPATLAIPSSSRHVISPPRSHYALPGCESSDEEFVGSLHEAQSTLGSGDDLETSHESISPLSHCQTLPSPAASHPASPVPSFALSSYSPAAAPAPSPCQLNSPFGFGDALISPDHVNNAMLNGVNPFDLCLPHVKPSSPDFLFEQINATGLLGDVELFHGSPNHSASHSFDHMEILQGLRGYSLSGPFPGQTVYASPNVNDVCPISTPIANMELTLFPDAAFGEHSGASLGSPQSTGEDINLMDQFVDFAGGIPHIEQRRENVVAPFSNAEDGTFTIAPSGKELYDTMLWNLRNDWDELN